MSDNAGPRESTDEAVHPAQDAQTTDQADLAALAASHGAADLDVDDAIALLDGGEGEAEQGIPKELLEALVHASRQEVEDPPAEEQAEGGGVASALQTLLQAPPEGVTEASASTDGHVAVGETPLSPANIDNAHPPTRAAEAQIGNRDGNTIGGDVDADAALPVENQLDPAASAADSALPEQAAAVEEELPMEMVIDETMLDAQGEDEGFDPKTLANLAALSRIAQDEGDDGEGQADGAEQFQHSAQHEEEMARLATEQDAADREKIKGIMERLHEAGRVDREAREAAALAAREKRMREGGHQDGDEMMEDDDQDQDREGEGGMSDEEDRLHRHDSEGQDRSSLGGDEDGAEDEQRGDGNRDMDGEYKGEEGKEKFFYAKGRLKRRRNRTVLSCTECHRRCDRNIPCNRCIKRGIPGMCRMEHPVLPQRKKRKTQDEAPVNIELGLRVQALEALIRSNANMDATMASAAAMETVLQATKAAHLGNSDAENALAQLSGADGLDAMGEEERRGLLMDVLQQLSSASLGKADKLDPQASIEEMRDIWSTLPEPPEAGPSKSRTYTPPENEEPHPFVDLTLAGFREDNGRLFIPPTVRHAEKTLRASKDMISDGMTERGWEPFLDSAVRFAYGSETPPYRKGLVSSVQTQSLGGAMRLAATFLTRFPTPVNGIPRIIYVPDPTSAADASPIRESGLDVRTYRFVDASQGAVDWEGVKDDLGRAIKRSVVLLFVGGSRPTGLEYTAAQWRVLVSILQERQLIPLVVLASQGLCSGDVNKDAQPLRYMVHEGIPLVAVQSFAATMGISADPPSVVSIATTSAEAKARVESQLQSVARTLQVSPSPYGAKIAHTILSDPKLYAGWLNEIKAMADRLRSVREKIYELLVNKLKTPGNWQHFRKATGMYCTVQLPLTEVDALISSRNIHLCPDGSFSLGCLNLPKIESLCKGIDHVVREAIRAEEEAQRQRIAMELALAAAREAAAREEALEAARQAEEAARIAREEEEAARQLAERLRAEQEAEEARLAAEAEIALAAEAIRSEEERAKLEEERAREEEERAIQEDADAMRRGILSAIAAQEEEEEEERRREEERREMTEAIRIAAEKAETARMAEEILASMGGAR